MQLNMNRRAFLRNSAVTAVATAIAFSPAASRAVLATTNPRAPKQQSASQDLDILNYALTLEHLEATAYRAINASGLMSGYPAKYFVQIGAHEADHVVTLDKTIRSLGGTPVAALASYNWPAFKSQAEVLTYFQAVEELGAAAYLGQAPRLQNPDLLTAAVSIHNVEAQHAAILSDLIGVSPSPAFGAPKTMEQVLAVVTPILTPGVPTMPGTGLGGAAYLRSDEASR
jgi:rubrerythrin